MIERPDNLIRHRDLHVGGRQIHVSDASRHTRRRQVRQRVREYRRAGLTEVPNPRHLLQNRFCLEERRCDRVLENAVVIQAVAHLEERLAVAGHVVGQREARPEVVLVAAVGQTLIVREMFDVVSYAVVDGQAVVHPPRVLSVRRRISMVAIQLRRSEEL